MLCQSLLHLDSGGGKPTPSRLHGARPELLPPEAREARTQCLEHPRNVGDASLDCCGAFGWIEVAFGFAAEMPFGFRPER